MNDERINLYPNSNTKHKNQNKTIKGLKQKHQMCKQKYKQFFIMIKHENINIK
jgi:hypothetical protein